MRMLHDFGERPDRGDAGKAAPDTAAVAPLGDRAGRLATLPTTDAPSAAVPRARRGAAFALLARISWRELAFVLVASLLFGALAYAGIHFARVVGRIAAVWIANGFAVALLLRAPRSLCVPLVLGMFAANVAADLLHADPLARALLLSLANQVEILCVFLLMRASLAPEGMFESGAVIGRYIGAALVGAGAGALMVAIGLALLEGEAPFAIAEAWFVSDLFGLLIVGPLLLSLPPRTAQWRQPSPAMSLARLAEHWLLIGGIVGVTALLFWQDHAPYLFVLGPLLVLSAFRLTLFAACGAILAAAAVAIAQTARGLGPVAELAHLPTLQLYALQAFIASMIILVLPVRALVAERVRLGIAADLSERKFARMAQASVAGIMHVDRFGQATWANDRWARFAPMRPRAGSEPWIEVVAEGSRDRLLSLWAQVRATLRPVSGEFPAAEGSAAGWIALSINPELDGDQVPTGFVIRITDITERRTAEDRLAESERRYRLVTDNVSDLVLRLNREAIILFASDAADRMLGWRPAMIEGQSLRDLLHGDDWPEFQRALADLYGAGAGQVELRFRQRGSDGRFRWIEGSLRPILDERDGEPREIVASFRDISQRIRTEQIVTESAAKLRESNRLISLAEDLARVGHWRLDFAASSFDYSIQINRIAGISRRETLTPRRALRLLDGEDRRILLATLARARRAERACECEVGVRAQDGARRRVCIVVQGDRAHGELTGMIGVVRDVTAERRAHDELVRARDRAKAAAQAKARFLATMSHEIRTPMTGVMGMIDLLARDPSPADRARYFDMLRTSADLLLAVLDDILDFSKIDSGRLLLERRPFALDRLLEESAAMFERRASEKGLTLRFAHEGRPCAVLGDAMRLRQVVSNLLSNAIKFSERGAIELALATSESGGDTRVAITVRDEGIGIDPALHADLFDPFVQADESTSRQFGGTGLGLAICRRLVEAMDGTVSLDSAPGAGSTFRVDLLLPTAALETVEVEAAPSAPGPRQAVRPLDLLVAEDNPVNQMLIGAILRADGHRVHAVENGRLAVEAAARERFDAIIMDMQMPEMDGLAATRAIRASGGPCAEVPILALTADASPERRRSYDGAGLSAFLTKPIDQEALSDQLRAIARLSDQSAPPPVDPGHGIEQAESPRASEPETTAAPSPLLDTARIAEIETVLGAERVHQLLMLLDTELAQRPQAIVGAIAAGDRPTALALAHGLKGAAGNIGADAVASLAAAFTEPGADLVALGRRLEAVAERTRKAINVFSAPPVRAAHL